MAQPNIVNVGTIRGNTALMNVTTVSTNVVVNSVSSNKVYKVNTLLISNIDGTNSADISAEFWRAGIFYDIASTITVPADATLVLISKDTSIYLEEGDYIRLQASANNDLNAILSYEEIS
jgi:hypothetical protein